LIRGAVYGVVAEVTQNNDSGSATLKYFGSQMKLFRGRAGLTRAELGARVGYSEATVASVEQGRRIPQQEFIDQADEALGAGGILRAGAPFLVQARYPAWFQDFALLEADAVSLYSYENQVMPGILQTEQYARAVFATNCPPLEDDELERRVEARLDRQRLLTRKPVAVLGFVIEEVVVRRPLGGRAVLNGQLSRLLELAGRRNVSVQVMPSLREAHGGLSGPMVLLDTPERRNLAYVEGQSGSFLVSERDEVGTLAQRYGIIRAQALNPEESLRLIEQVAGEQ
jgi:transcriptional regulator with XRE-family HTH domain